MPISGVQGSSYRMDPYQPWTLTSGMRIHLRAEDYTGTSWPNYYKGTGFAPDPTIVGTPAPQIIPNALNGKPVVRFTANEGRIRGTGLITTASKYDVAVAFLARQWGPTKGRMFSNQYNGTTEPYNWLVGSHSSGEPCCYDNGWFGAAPTGWGPIPTPWKIYLFSSAADFDPPPAANGGFYVNNATAVHGGGSTSTGHSTAYCLGGLDPTGPGETGDFDIAEFMGFNYGSVSISDCERYLRDRWGLNARNIQLTSINPTTTNVSSGIPFTMTCNGSGFVQGDTQYQHRHPLGQSTFGLATVVSPTVCTFSFLPTSPGNWQIILRSLSAAGSPTPPLTYVGTGVSPP